MAGRLPTRCSRPFLFPRRHETDRRKGQGLVEFVLIFPLLLLFLGVVVDVARFMEMRLTLSEVAHDAGRYAVIKNPVTGAFPTDQKVLSRITAQMPTGAPVPTVLMSSSATVNGEVAVSLRLTVAMTAFTPGVAAVFGGPALITTEIWYPKR